MSVPAGLMQALQGAGGGAGPGGPPPGVPPSIQVGGGDQAGSDTGGGGWESDLRNALDALRTLAQDATDHQETLAVDKAITILQGLLASRQSGQESLMGITATHKAMARGSNG